MKDYYREQYEKWFRRSCEQSWAFGEIQAWVKLAADGKVTAEQALAEIAALVAAERAEVAR